ncbi:MAG TPA: DUF6612 family protein [Nocardioides sp.]|nr:DUF6612 family protein [Nocardioides sp.]
MRATTALIRRTSVSAVAALLVSGLAACGSGGSDSPAAAGSSSTTSTTSAGTDTSPSAASSAPGVAAGTSISKADMTAVITKGIGAIDTAHETLTMNTSAGGKQVQMTGEADVQMKPMAMTMTMSLGGAQVQERFVDGVMYMQMPGVTTGGKWLKLDVSQMSSMMGGSGVSDALTNPLKMMDKMTGYITDATYVGADSVNGAAVKHYRMTIDLKSAMATMFPNLPSSATGSIGSKADEDIWVDSQGRAVKTEVDFGTGSMTTVLSDFGKKVSVQAPPASQVTTAPGMGG